MTLVGWMIIIGSIFVVMSVFDVLGNLRSLETREMVEGYLDESPGDTLGWSVATGLEALRITAMVTAVCATSAVVLGWFVLQRNAGARIALSVLAVPLFLTGMITGGFVSSMVAAGVVLLWMQPARSWFKGETPPAPAPLGRDDRGARAWGQGPDDSGESQAPAHAPSATAPVTVGSPGSTDARPVQGFGDRPTWQAPVNPYGLPVAGSPDKRPGAAWLAAVLTWVFAGFSLLSGVASLILLQTDPDALLGDAEEMVARLEEQSGNSGQLTAESLTTSMNLVGTMLIVFSLAACIAAVLMLRRRPQGAVVLMIVAALSAGFCLLGALLVPPLALPGLASLAVVLLLRRRDVRAWLRPQE